MALSGNDTFSVNGTVLSDFADGNIVEMTFPNDIAKVKTGKNGNSIFAQDYTGNNAEVKVRLIRGSIDDATLNGLLINQNNNFPGTVLLIGQFIKKLGDSNGNIISDTYNLSGGIIAKIPEAKSNVEGDVDQSVVVYQIKFSNVVRAIVQ